jgi:hypothetical protein
LSGLDRIGGPLRALLHRQEIIARCELLNRTYDIVRAADLSPLEKDEIERLVGSKVAAGVFSNVLSGTPLFFDLPKLDTYTVLNGRIFHFVHMQRYGKKDFESAYSRFQISMPELKAILRQNLADLLTDLMEDAGYRLMSGDSDSASGRFLFEASDQKADCLICTSIRAVNLEDCPPKHDSCSIILVPSGENLDPFMQFFREKGAAYEESGIQIWVGNLEQGSIDPFIGYTTNMDIYRQFKNPRLAQTVRSTWGSGKTAR